MLVEGNLVERAYLAVARRVDLGQVFDAQVVVSLDTEIFDRIEQFAPLAVGHLQNCRSDIGTA